MPSNYCRICGKPLTDFTSVKLGIGPVCRASRAEIKEGDLFMDFHADFSIIDIEDDYIYIKDRCGPNKSVTNDAEWVLAELHKRFDIAGKRIFYMDTEGIIDELVHENGIFKAFRPGHMGCNFQWEKTVPVPEPENIKSDFEMVDWEHPVREERASFKMPGGIL